MRKHEAEVKPKRNMAVKAHSMRDLLLNREYSPRQTRKANNEGVSGPSTISFIMEELGSLFGKNSTDFDMKIMKNNFDPKE